MKAKIKVGFSTKFQAKPFTPVEQSDSLELEVEYTSEEDLEKQLEKWQAFIQKKVVKASMLGANSFVEALKELE